MEPKRQAPAQDEPPAPTSPLRAAVLVALFVAAAIAALRIIDVRPFAVFQHYLAWSDLVRSEPVALGVLVVQTLACVAVAGPARLAAGTRGFVRRIGPWRSLLALGILTFSLEIPAESVERFAGEVALAGWIAAAAVLNVVVAARALPPGLLGRARAWVAGRLTIERGAEGLKRWDRRLPWFAAAWVLVVCAAVAWFVFERVPHIDDSVMYLFQAKYFALGRLHLAPPPDVESFAEGHMLFDGVKWYSKFFPGWPAVLAVGVAAGVPWLVNPILGALAIPLTHALVRRLYDRATANACALLLAASPWLLFTSSEMVAHAVVLDLALLALLAIELQRDRRAGPWSVVAGLCLGAMFLCRPFDAALFGPVAALFALGVAGRRLSFGSLATVAAVAGACACVMFAYQRALTGNPMLPPHKLWADTIFGPGVDVLGFGPNVGIPLWRNVDPLPGHGLPDILLNANKNFYLTSFELFGWATGSLVLIVLCGLKRWERGDVLMLGVLLFVIGGHSFYWAAGGPDFGGRYWYLILVAAVVLTVRGGQALAALLADAGPPGDAGPRIVAAVAVASATALVCVVPWRCVTKYHRYRDIGGEVRALAAENGFDGSLVFVRAPVRSDYQSAFNFNSPLLDGPGAVYARDCGAEHRAAVVRRYPGRPVWVIGRKEGSGNHLVVLGGPFEAGRSPDLAPYEYAHPLQADVR